MVSPVWQGKPYFSRKLSDPQVKIISSPCLACTKKINKIQLLPFSLHQMTFLVTFKFWKVRDSVTADQFVSLTHVSAWDTHYGMNEQSHENTVSAHPLYIFPKSPSFPNLHNSSKTFLLIPHFPENMKSRKGLLQM